ncbi:MAG: hypothetical protein ACI8XM_002835, partial [Haloarculaceae archaeon]
MRNPSAANQLMANSPGQSATEKDLLTSGMLDSSSVSSRSPY